MPRLGLFAAVHPEALVAAAIEGALSRAGCSIQDCGQLLIAVDTPVGAQATNLARRVARRLGASALPALTIDGQGIGDLASLGLASPTAAPVIIAGVDSTSIVAPGAALVRDYGRPTPDEVTETGVQQRVVAAEGLTRGALDARAQRLRQAISDAPPSGQHIIAVSTSDIAVSRDVPAPLLDVDGLLALGDDGQLTAAHQASVADGAAAVVLSTSSGRAITRLELRAAEPGDALELLIEVLRTAPSPVLLVDASVAIHEALARRGMATAGPESALSAVCSAPSADGLRTLVDALATRPTAFTVVRRGRGGQVVSTSVGDA